jgi:hypothetical protein
VCLCVHPYLCLRGGGRRREELFEAARRLKKKIPRCVPADSDLGRFFRRQERLISKETGNGKYFIRP